MPLAMTLAKACVASPLCLAAVLAAGTLFSLCAAPRPAAAQPAAQAHLADAPAIGRAQQRAHCEAELRRMKQSPGLGDGQSDQVFMKTCLADIDPVAVLPGSGAVINAPAGATGVCRDGTYASAVRRDDACRAHGGLARWFGR